MKNHKNQKLPSIQEVLGEMGSTLFKDTCQVTVILTLELMELTS